MQNNRCYLSEILNRDMIPGNHRSLVGIPFLWDILTTMINTEHRGSTLLRTQKESLISWVKFDESDQTN